MTLVNAKLTPGRRVKTEPQPEGAGTSAEVPGRPAPPATESKQQGGCLPTSRWGINDSRLLQRPQVQVARRTVRFEVDIPQAWSISVVGTFNDWNPAATPLTFIGGIKWRQELSLAPGRYEYRFVLDGRWIDPPNAKAYVPGPRGGHNAVLEV